MADKTKSIEDFVKFTCSTETEARSYLENSGWNTEMALLMYFDDRDERVGATTERLPNITTPVEDIADSDNDEPTEAEAPEPFTFAAIPERSSTGRQAPLKANRTNVRTLTSLRSNEDEEEDEDQLYYAGGSQGSGQQIMGNDRRGDVAGEVFKHLKQMVSVGNIDIAGSSRETEGASFFTGTGYRLGQTPDDTKIIGASSQRSDARPEIHLRLWRNGFTVGEEPLRSYAEPENREALVLLMSGEVPPSLIPPGTTDGKVNVQVEDLRHDVYPDLAPRTRYFTGAGHVLGNVVPDIVTDEPMTVPKESVQSNESASTVDSPLQINENEPVTTVMIRLPSGTRSQVRANLSHTVEDLRQHLTTVHSELNGHVFAFMVNFPPKEVTDEKVSIKEAGLMNSSVNLRIKK